MTRWLEVVWYRSDLATANVVSAEVVVEVVLVLISVFLLITTAL